MKAKKPNSSVPGDIPKKVLTEFAVEFSKPAAIIMNKITQHAEYPRQWVVEFQSAIPKTQPPLSENDLRLISGTAFFSKVYEAFLRDWLMPIVSPHLDPANYGGFKGISTGHYLINLLHFIHSNLDNLQPHAVLLAQVDLAKAFNRVSHQHVIQDLFDMHVPGWLLRILVSYLTERNMTLKYRGVQSSRHFLPGSAPQGVFLGVFIFIIIFNAAFVRPSIPRNMLQGCPVDPDAINLKKCLTDDHVIHERPLTYHQRTGHVLDPQHNHLQLDLDNLEEFVNSKQLKINDQKSTVMAFNFSRSYDFPPDFHIGNNELQVVRESKVLGVVIRDDLKWDSHISYTCKRAARKIWVLRRMMQLGLDYNIILDIYQKEIRAILEYEAVVFHSGLSHKLSGDLENIQRTVLGLLSFYIGENSLIMKHVFFSKLSPSVLEGSLFVKLL